MLALPGSTRATRSGSALQVNLRTLLAELYGLGLQAALECFLIGQPLFRRIVAHVLRDLHRAEVRPAHRAEVRELGTVLRQRLVVELACLVRIEPEVELV